MENSKALQYIMSHADIKFAIGRYAHTDNIAAAGDMRRTLEGSASVASFAPHQYDGCRQSQQSPDGAEAVIHAMRAP